MRIVLQRVHQSTVSVEGTITGKIGKGILILLGVHATDTETEAEFCAKKCAELRIFSDEAGKMNRSVLDIDGEALVVSQFTLYGDCRKGRRPSFVEAARPEKGNELYEYFVACLKQRVHKVETGIFGAMMDVEIVNDGPVTMIVEKMTDEGKKREI
ncbi:MAG: D-tyrosyl-tRNA(Tyr) deacylase [Chitinivibrionales bacterium]|nr:D-tyrosyl-tRNA(Tyr) deacylase [Chitinivibrionales bacterium]